MTSCKELGKENMNKALLMQTLVRSNHIYSVNLWETGTAFFVQRIMDGAAIVHLSIASNRH